MNSNFTKKQLGAFYTPEYVTQMLADWAVRDSKDTILDPSFGGCAFLTSALKKLETIGAVLPAKQIFGVDIDERAFAYLANIKAKGAKDEQFFCADFFELQVSSWPKGFQLFDVILSNPPYIRYHDLPKHQYDKANQRLLEQGFSVSGRTSLWGYFAIRSLAFLKENGRLILVLPGAFLHTDYAQEIQKILIQSFRSVKCILIRERLFSDTDEESVIFCGDGAHHKNCGVTIKSIDSILQLEEVLNDDTEHSSLNTSSSFEWISTVIGDDAYAMYQNLKNTNTTISMGEYVKCGIGVVTGANDKFILTHEKWNELKLPYELARPIIRRSEWMKGVLTTSEDILWIKKQGLPYLLLDIFDNNLIDSPVRKYLDHLTDLGISSRTKCRNRNPWFRIPDTQSPDAFYPIMSAGWSHVIVNQSKATCTNNIARLSWISNNHNMSWSQIAIGSLSSYGQLSAEIVGRSYGGGVLKVEPREFANLTLPILPLEIVEDISAKVNQFLLMKQQSLATECVDKAIQRHLGWSDLSIKEIRQARNKLLSRRRGHRNDISKIIMQ